MTHTPPLMHVPPPVLFAVAFGVGLGLQHLVPLDIEASGIAATSRAIGVALLACGVLLGLSCVTMFALARTTVIPHGTASTLMTRGPYRFTRNPMYVGLILVYLGAAGVLVEVWPLVLLPIPVAFVNGIVIPFEEARLRDRFGHAYDAYRASVRRWV